MLAKAFVVGKVAAKNSGHILTLTPKSPFATTPSFFSKERGGGGSGDGGGSDDPSGNSNKTAAVVQAMLSRSWSSMVGPPRVEESPFDNPRRLRKPLVLDNVVSTVIVEDNNSSSSQHGQDRVYAILARQDEELVQKAIGTPLTLADVEKTVHQQIDQNDGPLPFETAIDDKTAEGKAAATESLTFSAAAEEKPDDKKVLSHDEMAAAENAAYSGRPAALLAIASYTGSFRRFRVWANDGKDPTDKAFWDGLAADERRRLTMVRSTRYGFVFLSVFFFCGVVVFVWYNAFPSERDQYSGSWMATLYRIRDAVFGLHDVMMEPVRSNLLPDPVKYPFYQPKYTLVMEMKHLLVHPQWDYKRGHHFVKRPALDYFLEVAGYPNFELVIYTSETLFTAPAIIEAIDQKHKIAYRLYRENTKLSRDQGKLHYVKDLSRLNRDLSKVIFIDCEPESAQSNPDNLLLVPKWDGAMTDTQLIDLAELLKTIHVSDVEDVRPTLQHYSQFDNPMSEFRRRAQLLGLQEEQARHPTTTDGGGSGDGGTGGGTSSSTRKYTMGSLFGMRRHAV